MRRWASQLSCWLALAVVALAPLPFGSVSPAWVTAWCAAIAASLLLAGVPAVSAAQMRVLFAALGAFVCLLLAVWLQILTAVPDATWLRARALLGEGPAALSLMPRLPSLVEIGNSLLFTLVFCRLFLLGADGPRSRQVFRVVAWSGLGYALYGALAFAFDPGHILWRPKVAYLGNLTGTFVNRNTAATYFGSVTVLWTILLIAALRRDRASRVTASERLWLVLSGHDAALVGLFFGTLLCLGATAATGSRAGFLLTLITVLLVAILYGRIGWRHLRRRLWLVLGIGLMAILALEMLSGLVTTRLHLIGFDGEGRLDVYLSSIGLTALRPWLGWGLGSFETVFATVRPETAGMTGVWDRAHSSLLEWAVELGIPFAVLLGCLWLWLFGKLLRSSLHARSPIVIAGCAVGFLGTLHSSIDFSLQIPGFAVTFAALTAVGLAQATSASPEQATDIGLRSRGGPRAASHAGLSKLGRSGDPASPQGDRPLPRSGL